MKKFAQVAVAMASLYIAPICQAGNAAGVPEWVTPAFSSLAKEGYLKLPLDWSKGLNRDTAARYTAYALSRLENRAAAPGYKQADCTVKPTGYGRMLWLEVPKQAACERLALQISSLDSQYKQAYRQAVQAYYELALQSERDMEVEVVKRLKAKSEASVQRLFEVANRRAVLIMDLNCQTLRKKYGADYKVRVVGANPLGEEYAATLRMCADDEAHCRRLTAELKKTRHFVEKAQSSGQKLAANKQLEVVTDRLKQRSVLLAKGKEKLQQIEQRVLDAADTGQVTETEKVGQLTPDVVEMAGRLRAEFAMELSLLGFFDDENAQQLAQVETVPLPTAEEMTRFKLDGEFRLDNGEHHGPASSGSRTRVRGRLYADYNIDGNWHAKGMAEYEKTFRGKGYSNDGKLRLNRYYLEGRIGEVLTDIGMFGSLMAEGNIYDGSFRGIRAVFGDKLKFKAEGGRTARYWLDHRGVSLSSIPLNAYNAVLSYDAGSCLFELGYYHFNNNGRSMNISMANYRQPLGKFDLGLMYLRGATSREAGMSGNGFVATLSYGREMPWRKGAVMYYLKYYRQPRSTYVMHTMNGLADNMWGFRGIGIGFSYTIQKDWLLNVEYDRLRDLETRERNNTLWLALTYFFRNYNDY